MRTKYRIAGLFLGPMMLLMVDLINGLPKVDTAFGWFAAIVSASLLGLLAGDITFVIKGSNDRE